jgi:hypothetical protein
MMNKDFIFVRIQPAGEAAKPTGFMVRTQPALTHESSVSGRYPLYDAQVSSSDANKVFWRGLGWTEVIADTENAKQKLATVSSRTNAIENAITTLSVMRRLIAAIPTQIEIPRASDRYFRIPVSLYDNAGTPVDAYGMSVGLMALNSQGGSFVQVYKDAAGTQPLDSATGALSGMQKLLRDTQGKYYFYARLDANDVPDIVTFSFSWQDTSSGAVLSQTYAMQATKPDYETIASMVWAEPSSEHTGDDPEAMSQLMFALPTLAEMGASGSPLAQRSQLPSATSSGDANVYWNGMFSDKIPSYVWNYQPASVTGGLSDTAFGRMVVLANELLKADIVVDEQAGTVTFWKEGSNRSNQADILYKKNLTDTTATKPAS